MKTLIFIAWTTFIVGCKSKNDFVLETSLDKAFTNYDSVIKFNLFKDDYDSIMLVSPYTSNEQIEKKLNINLKDVPYNLKHRDDMSMILLFKNRKYINYIPLSTYKIGFEKAHWKMFSKDYGFKFKSFGNEECIIEGDVKLHFEKQN